MRLLDPAFDCASAACKSYLRVDWIMMEARSRALIKATLNRSFADFGQHEFTKRSLVEIAEGDAETLAHSLSEWAAKGYLRVVTPLSSAAVGDVCVYMISPIGWESPTRDS